MGQRKKQQSWSAAADAMKQAAPTVIPAVAAATKAAADAARSLAENYSGRTATVEQRAIAAPEYKAAADRARQARRRRQRYLRRRRRAQIRAFALAAGAALAAAAGAAAAASSTAGPLYALAIVLGVLGAGSFAESARAAQRLLELPADPQPPGYLLPPLQGWVAPVRASRGHPTLSRVPGDRAQLMGTLPLLAARDPYLAAQVRDAAVEVESAIVPIAQSLRTLESLERPGAPGSSGITAQADMAAAHLGTTVAAYEELLEMTSQLLTPAPMLTTGPAPTDTLGEIRARLHGIRVAYGLPLEPPAAPPDALGDGRPGPG